MRHKANLILLFVAMIWGTSFIAQDIAAQHGTALLYNGASFFLGGLLLRPFIKKEKQEISKGQWKWMFIAGIALFLASYLQQIGMFYTRVANASFLTSLYIVVTPLLLWVGFRERPNGIEIAAVIAATLGAYLLSTLGQGIAFRFGDILEIAGALFWGMHVIILGKYASRYNAISFASGHFLITGIIQLVIGFFTEDLNLLFGVPVILSTIYRSIFSISVGYTLQIWSQNHTQPTATALILGLESVFAALFAWIILGQNLHPIQIIGCAVILAAALLPQMRLKPAFTMP